MKGAKSYFPQKRDKQQCGCQQHNNGQYDQRLGLALPKSTSFLDRFLQNAVATRISPANSGGNPFWPQFRFGLARTSGLRQNARPETLFFPWPTRVLRVDDGASVGVRFHSGVAPDESPLPDRDRSQSSKGSGVISGDNPRGLCQPVLLDSSA